MTPKFETHLRRILLVQLYVLSFGWGMSQLLQHAWLGYLIQLLIPATGVLWAVSDARQRGRPILSIVQFMMVLTWAVTLPIYLMKSRRVRGFGWAVLNFFGMCWAYYLGFIALESAHRMLGVY